MVRPRAKALKHSLRQFLRLGRTMVRLGARSAHFIFYSFLTKTYQIELNIKNRHEKCVYLFKYATFFSFYVAFWLSKPV